MRICQFYDGFYPGSGGIETHIRDLTLHLPLEFEIVADQVPGSPAEEMLSERVRVHRIGPQNTVISAQPNPINSKVFFPLRVAGDWVRIRAKRKYLSQTRFSLVHFHGTGIGSSLSRMARFLQSRKLVNRLEDWRALDSPKVLTVHGLISFMSHDRYFQDLEKDFVSQFPDIICVDLAIRERVEEYVRSIAGSSRVHFIPNGIDLDLFPRASMDFSERLRVGFAGRLETSRGLDVLESLVGYRDDELEFHVAGLGNDREIRRFEDAVRGRGVWFYPNLNPQSMPAFYRKINVLLNPVIVPGISRVALESMAMGRPSIMSSRGNRYPIVDGDTGFLVPDDARRYREQLKWLARHPSLVVECGTRGSDLVRQEFGVRDMCRRIKDVYDGCLLGDSPA